MIRMSFSILKLLVAGWSLAALCAQAGDTTWIHFENETVGAEPKIFKAVVGNWSIGLEGKNRLLVVDGTRWAEGQPAAGLADKAKTLYGARYAEFLDNINAYAYFPFAVLESPTDFRDGAISFRFKGLTGRVDQAAGILFNLKENGDYFTLRANCLEDNLVLWKVEKGQRSKVKWIRKVRTPSEIWHDLKMEIDGTTVKGYLDGVLYLEHKLSEPVTGRVGLWTKADSHMWIDDFRVVRK